MADPTTYGMLGGAIVAGIATFVKLYKVDKRQKTRDSEMVEVLKVFKEAVQPTNGKDRARGSEAVPGFAPECSIRAKEHGERITKNETRIANFDSRFDGLNRKIESVREDLKGDIENLKEDVREKIDEVKAAIRNHA